MAVTNVLDITDRSDTNNVSLIKSQVIDGTSPHHRDRIESVSRDMGNAKMNTRKKEYLEPL